MKKTISLDDFLADQSNNNFLCTLELVPSERSKIKIKPWIDEDHGCTCDSEIVIDKTLIESVFPTDQTHLCCGKKQKIVEIIFKKDAAIKIEDVFKMSIKRTSENKGSHNSKSLDGPGYQNYESFMSPVVFSKNRGQIFSPNQNLAFAGCGMGQRESNICKSGCECRDIHGHWFCCPQGCCP